MITAGKGIDEFLFGRRHRAVFEKGDIVIDAANSFYEDTVRRAKLLKKKASALWMSVFPAARRARAMAARS